MRSLGPSVGDIAFLVLYVFGLALGLAVCGLYGQDLHQAQEKHVYADSKWVYAVVVGALSAASSVVYMVPLILRIADVTSATSQGNLANIMGAAWDCILWILWLVVFGIFGNMYIGTNPQGASGVVRMKNAVWVDLANFILWFLLACAAVGYWWKHRDPHSRFTGRAHV